jgi:hypothetical protein
MHEFWENLISRKYSPKSSIYNVKAMILTKFQTGTVFKYFGYTQDHEEVINVHFYETPAGFYISIGIGDNEYSSISNMTPIHVISDEPKDDLLVKNTLIDMFSWKIDFFSTICD